jgi:hypothetical protein
MLLGLSFLAPTAGEVKNTRAGLDGVEFALSADGRTLALASYQSSFPFDWEIRLWDLEGGKECCTPVIVPRSEQLALALLQTTTSSSPPNIVRASSSGPR